MIDFLRSSLKDGTVSSDDAESLEVAQQCIADSFGVDASDGAAMADALGGQSLTQIYGVYEKLRDSRGGSSNSSADGAVPAGGASASASAAATPAAPNAEAEAFKSAGNAAMQAKDYAGAIENYSKALNLAPLNAIYLSNRAAAYSASGQHAQASTDAEQAVAADPAYTKAWSRLGLARFALGDAKGSMEAYQKGIEYEGNGGSAAMKKGFETAKRKVEEEESAAGGEEGARDASAGAGAGGMPDLSSLAGMFGGGGRGGGGGMPDLAGLMNNPMFSNMAQNLMSNPDMMNNIMSNPRLRQMAESFGGRGGGAGGGGMPDVAGLMSDPNIAEM